MHMLSLHAADLGCGISDLFLLLFDFRVQWFQRRTPDSIW